MQVCSGIELSRFRNFFCPFVKFFTGLFGLYNKLIYICGILMVYIINRFVILKIKTMEDKQLNEKESLELIAKMIQNTRQKLKKGSGLPFLIWGYVTIATSLLVWYLLETFHDYRAQYLWFLILIVGGLATWIMRRKHESGVRTYIDKVLGDVWMVVGFAGFLISVTAIFYWQLPILFLIVLLMGCGTAITGLVIRFKPIAISGFAGLFLSMACLFVPGYNQILAFAAVFLVMMVIPGHILYAKGRSAE